ncbi:MAG: hypothetical protein WCX73_02125 [Candidatus Pacearchaeota archaeon]|jgi:hypothetical protein
MDSTPTFKRKYFTKIWKVSSLGSSSNIEKDVISIDKSKFDSVLYSLPNSYPRSNSCPEGTEYPHRQYSGISVIVNKEQKTITAKAVEESYLSVVANELKLPQYTRYA